MQVIVLGGGIVGVTAAYELLRDGHEVVLIEANEQVGEETSWGNAGMIAPGHSFAWSSPQAPFTLLKSLVTGGQSLRFKPSLDPRLYSWSLRFLRECTHARSTRNTRIKHRLCTYSQSVFQETARDTDFQFDRRSRGILFFYGKQADLETGVEHMKILSDNGQQIEIVDRKRLAEIDASLGAGRSQIAGGIYCPTDETGDCSLFTKGLAQTCIAMGCDIRTGTTIQRIHVDGDRVIGVETDKGMVKGDKYVLSLGNYSPIHAAKIGIKLPIYPVKGYSMTVPIGNAKHPPQVACVDEDKLVAITPYKDRIRVTATAEFAGYNTAFKPKDFKFMTSVVKAHYPDGAEYDRAEYWAGLRPMTPEGTPILGPSGKYPNLILNSGQGHMGWTMSHATARITADLIAGRSPAIPLDGMTQR